MRGDVCHEMNVYLVVEFDSLSMLLYQAITVLSIAFQASLQLSRWHTDTLTNINDIQSQLYAQIALIARIKASTKSYLHKL